MPKHNRANNRLGNNGQRQEDVDAAYERGYKRGKKDQRIKDICSFLAIIDKPEYHKEVQEILQDEFDEFTRRFSRKIQ